MSKPWKDWLPGVLSDEQVGKLCPEFLVGVEDEKAIKLSSVDLCLSGEGYKMLKGSVKPFNQNYRTTILENPEFAVRLEPHGGVFQLEPKKTYLFRLRESLRGLKGTNIYGQATARSSIGRLDVLARLIVEGMNSYEEFDHSCLPPHGAAEMFLEVTPMTFGIKVKEGIPLSQLRFFYDKPETSAVHSKLLIEALLHAENPSPDGSLSVDLSHDTISSQHVSAFGTLNHTNEYINAWEEEDDASKHCPCKYWPFLKPDSRKRITITKGNFYILRSKERLALPAGVAAYCRASDETIGEMRIHYAGFVHPFFGKNRIDGQIGTSLIFEVRGHDMDVSLRDGEKMAKLVFYRMSQDCKEPEKKGYNDQKLTLSKIFRSWPSRVRVDAESGVVYGLNCGDSQCKICC